MTADLETRLRTHVERLAGLIGPRHMQRPSSLEAAAVYVQRELELAGHEVELQPYDCGGAVARNLVVEMKGSIRPQDIVILGAHYDTIPQTPGADDNASAVAALIECARLLNGPTFRGRGRTQRIVAFTNEEPPHFYTQTMGSQIHARQCRERKEHIVGMVCLEMLGYFRDEQDSQRYPQTIPRPLRWALPRRGNFIAAVSNLRSKRLLWSFRRGFKKAAKFPLWTLPLPQAIHEIRLSDHGSFWDVGYPALMVTDTSFFRNPHYHQPTDLPATLDYPRLAQVTIGVAGAMSHIAGAGQ